MERLKAFDEIVKPDVRQSFFAKLTAEGVREINIEDFHNAAKSIALHTGVPDEVHFHFQTARHLLIYSWFYYPFNVTAELHAYIATEAALKIKAGKPKAMFKELMQEAVVKQWIHDDGFSLVQRKKEQFQRQKAETVELGLYLPVSAVVKPYVEVLCETLPFLRNCHAHGEIMLHNHGASTLRLCAELINQLFDNPPTK
jgi:hypothetical protein